MFCPSCGKEIKDSSLFCTYCGSTIPQQRRSTGQELPHDGTILLGDQSTEPTPDSFGTSSQGDVGNGWGVPPADPTVELSAAQTPFVTTEAQVAASQSSYTIVDESQKPGFIQRPSFTPEPNASAATRTRPKLNSNLIAALIAVAVVIVCAAIVIPSLLSPASSTAEETTKQEQPAVQTDENTDGDATAESDATTTAEPTTNSAQPTTTTAAPTGATQKVPVSIFYVDAASYPEMHITATFYPETASGTFVVSASELRVVETDASGAEHAGAITSAVNNTGSTSDSATVYQIVYTSGCGASAGETVNIRLEYADSAPYEGSATASYTLPAAAQSSAQQESTQQQSTSSSSSSWESEYVLPYSDSRYYSYDELWALSADELEIARNEIYARHGRGFATDYLQAYFNGCSWYMRLYDPADFDAMLAANPGMFNDYEYENVRRCNEVEDAKRAG